MRKIITCVLMSFLVVSIMGLFTACNPDIGSTGENSGSSVVEPQTYIVEFGFVDQSGGRVEGNLRQSIEEGGSTEKVVAIADEGYFFAGWADDYETYNSDETITRAERIIDDVRRDYYCLAMFERKTYTVNYIAGENGEIEGELAQSGKYGDETASVTAVPNIGYHFVGWSDGMTESTRNDQLIENKELTAIFELSTNKYTYNYKYADGNCDEEYVMLTYGKINEEKLPVPERAHATFGGWYADRYLTQQVSDENGNIVIADDELFLSKSTQLYAKWISENTRKYKILIVYVTELNAELTTKDGNGKIQVDYHMTDLERQICQMITEKISFELNDLAVADFQVDEYFTTVPLTKENIQEIHPINSAVDHKVYAYDIPEVYGLIDQYDSILTSYSMDDYFGDLHNSGGAANSKYGSINFDGGLTQLIYNNEPFENLLDPLHYYWDALLNTYLHEFAHTIELCVNNIFDYHTVVGKYLWDYDRLIAEKLYFLNKAVVDGETVGVPYEYWEGKVAEVYYQTTEGGTIHSKTGIMIFVFGHDDDGNTQYVIYGDDAMSVTAIPQNGYEFVGWSDGVETATRHDTNITEDLHVYAIFRPVYA